MRENEILSQCLKTFSEHAICKVQIEINGCIHKNSHKASLHVYKVVEEEEHHLLSCKKQSLNYIFRQRKSRVSILIASTKWDLVVKVSITS